MKKLFLFILLFYSFVNTQTYDIGDIISTTHQNQSFDVCYGDYFSNNFHFSDLNGAINMVKGSAVSMGMEVVN